MTKFSAVLVAGGVLVIILGATCGRFLVVDNPRKSDVIVILAGEDDRRLVRGLEVLDQGYAPRLLLDVPAEAKIYQWSLMELARKYVDGLPQASRIEICPIYAQSTQGETHDVFRCLQGTANRRILLVTS